MDAIYPYNVGGADKRLWELARKLAENSKHEVHIYGMKWWQGPDTIVTNNVHLHGVCKVRELYNEDGVRSIKAVSYTHLRAHETDSYLVCRLLLEKKKNITK